MENETGPDKIRENSADGRQAAEAQPQASPQGAGSSPGPPVQTGQPGRYGWQGSQGSAAGPGQPHYPPQGGGAGWQQQYGAAGQQMPAGAPQGYRPPEGHYGYSQQQPPHNTPAAPAKKNKTPLIVGGIVLLALIAAAVYLFLFVLPSQGSGDPRPYEYPYTFYFEEDGRPVLLKNDGTSISPDLKVKTGYLDREGNRLYYVDLDGNMLVYDVASGISTQLSEDVTRLVRGVWKNRYIIFQRTENAPEEIDAVLQVVADKKREPLDTTREYFEADYDGTSLDDALEFYEERMGEEYPVQTIYLLYDMEGQAETVIFDSEKADGEYNFALMFSEREEQFCYLNDEGDVCLVNTKGETALVGGVLSGKSAQILLVPDAGDLVVWEVTEAYNEDDFTLYANVGGREEKLYRGENNHSEHAVVNYNKSHTMAVVLPYGSEEVFELYDDGRVNRLRCDGDMIIGCALTAPSWDPPEKFEGYFVTTWDGSEGTLYYLASDGNREKVYSDVYALGDLTNGYTTLLSRGDTVFFKDHDDNLYSCTVTRGMPGEVEKIASDVYRFEAPEGGVAVWYTKGEYRDATLYRYDEGQAEKVAANCSEYYLTYDGTAALILTNIERIDEDRYYGMGSLYLWQDGEKTKIASDVAERTVNYYNYWGGYFDPDAFSYLSSCYLIEDSYRVRGDLYFYNGTDSVRIARNVY